MSLLADLRTVWARRHWRVVLIAGALALVGVALAGGLRRAPGHAADVPTASAGQTVRTGVFALTPLCAWSSDLRPGQPEIMRGPRRYLMVRARVENTGKDWLARAAYLGRDVVWLADGRSDPRDPERLQRADDHGLDVLLQPAQPTHVDLVWELPAGAAAPARAVFGIYKRRHVERGYLSGEEMWVQDGPGWRVPMSIGTACAAVAP